MKTIKWAALITVCISALYLLVSAILSFTAFSFRSWADVLGQLFVAVLTPIMVLVLVLFNLYRNERVNQTVKVVCVAAAVIMCSIYICAVMFLIALGNRDERILTRHLLVTNEAFLSEAEPVYYRPAAFFFKYPTDISKADQVEYLENKYQRAFAVSESGGIIYDRKFPEVKVSVWTVGMSLEDNYQEAMTLACLLEVYRGVDMERGYHIVEVNNREYLCLEAYGYDDISALSEDIVCLTAGAMSGGFSRSGDAMEFYQEYAGSIYYAFDGNERGYTGNIRFGGKGQEDFADVEEMVRSAYRQYGTGQDRSVRNPYKNIGENENGAEESMFKAVPEGEPEEGVESGSDYREKAAKAVYDAVLAEEGFSYEAGYNAKGNLYIDLGSKTSEEDGKTYSYSLVYDRPSENGACELLVLYRTLEGSENEAIVDMYAVETATGKVVASGRKAWSDVGTEEYREITGE